MFSLTTFHPYRGFFKIPLLFLFFVGVMMDVDESDVGDGDEDASYGSLTMEVGVYLIVTLSLVTEAS